MEKSRLFQLINTFSKKEIKEIRTFLASPFFNKRPEVQALFEALVTYIGTSITPPNKAQLYQQIKEKKGPYDDQTMRLWMSFLLKLLEQYLVYSRLSLDTVRFHRYLTSIYRERNLPKHQERQLRSLESAQQKSPFRNAAYFEDEFQIQLEKHRFLSTDRRMNALNLQKIVEPLDVAYISQKLQQACIARSHQAVYKAEYELGLIQELLIYVEQKALYTIPTIAVYYYGYLLLTTPEEGQYFRAFKKTLVIHQHLFPKEELGDLYLLGINFCIKKYNAGDRQFLEDEFELYQKGLEQDLLLKNNQLSRFTYRNVVTLGLVQGAYSWVESFIHAYRNKLDKVHRVTMFSFSLAQLAYHRKQYDEALQLLQKTNYRDVLLNLAAKTVMLKIFYELDEFDLLQAHLDAMRTFIRRKKVMGYHQENYVNLIYWTRKLIDSNPYDRSEKGQMLQDIQLVKIIAEREWLIDKLQEV